MFATALKYANSASMEKQLNDIYAAWKKQDDAYLKSSNIQFDHFRFPIYSYVNQATGRWYRYFVKYNAQERMSKIKIPILALNGDKYIMVSYKENLSNWKNYTSSRDITTAVIPGVNHLFLLCKECTPQETIPVDVHFSEKALLLISAWINKRF